MSPTGRRPTRYERYGKRPLDLLLAVPAAVLLAPMIGLVYLIVRGQLGAPAIFRQPRAGQHGRVFTLYKFRTMRDAYNQFGEPLPDEQRLTPLGRRLRSWSLDELPQLWNILRGDMSLVGPRPLLARYLERYTSEQARRHEVRPGITGWAQVNGRNAIRWEQKFELDVWYVDHCQLKVDLTILCRTMASVLLRRGISSDQHATMPEFMGQSAASMTLDSQEKTPS